MIAHTTSKVMSCSLIVELLPCKASLPADIHSEINAVDLARTVQVAALFHLSNLCIGCIGIDTLKRVIQQRSVQGLPTKV
jgi:hypothetical protein